MSSTKKKRVERTSTKVLKTRIELLCRLKTLKQPTSVELQTGWKNYKDVLHFIDFGESYSHGRMKAFVKLKTIRDPKPFITLFSETVTQYRLSSIKSIHTLNCQPRTGFKMNVQTLESVTPDNEKLFLEANRLLTSVSDGYLTETLIQNKCGRYYSTTFTLQGASKRLRHIALEGIEHCDIDQASAVFNIARNLFKAKGVVIPKELEDHILTIPKSERNKLMFNSKRFSNPDTIDASIKWWELVQEYCGVATTPSQWSSILFNEEARIQMKVQEKLEGAGHQIISHIFDGCLVTGTVSKKELTKIENEIKEEMGLTYFKLKNKGKC